MSGDSAISEAQSRAERESAGLPELLLEAEHLASALLLGEHGRRRAGAGADFWQFREADPGDSMGMVDWRRSGRGDSLVIKEREWQSAQTLVISVDRSQSMLFKGLARERKIDRARLLAIAAAILASRAGERFGLAGGELSASSGRVQVQRLAARMAAEDESDYSAPGPSDYPRSSRALFISDFLGDWGRIRESAWMAADRGARGALLQILDPAEETFPYDGRSIFESMRGSVRFETLRARNLKREYLERLESLGHRLGELAREIGWSFMRHSAAREAKEALLWIHQALGWKR